MHEGRRPRGRCEIAAARQNGTGVVAKGLSGVAVGAGLPLVALSPDRRKTRPAPRVSPDRGFDAGWRFVPVKSMSYGSWRMRWDSNPRNLSVRWFSRPVPSTARPLILMSLSHFGPDPRGGGRRSGQCRSDLPARPRGDNCLLYPQGALGESRRGDGNGDGKSDGEAAFLAGAPGLCFQTSSRGAGRSARHPGREDDAAW